MNYVAQIKECTDKQKVYDLGRTWSHIYIPFIRDLNLTSTLIDFSVNGPSQCTSTSFVRPSTNIYICRHHLSARYLTFTLLVIFFLLLVTASVNLHLIANGTDLHSFWTHKSGGRFEQFPTHICWGLWLRILRLLFLTFLSVPQGSHWYLKAGSLPPPPTLIKNHYS